MVTENLAETDIGNETRVYPNKEYNNLNKRKTRRTPYSTDMPYVYTHILQQNVVLRQKRKGMSA